MTDRTSVFLIEKGGLVVWLGARASAKYRELVVPTTALAKDGEGRSCKRSRDP
jgi:hypothetical protein